ncbi:hypothetical protein PR202_gb20522 [Eleusine coracana subsp. coracana]|uniref:Phospholipid/glycerol acyltransferase domain-containing protein n=1 Tax=Eleusine coracana subsp. coracana TaxID=191504 RepID=A0AAV5FCG3_ELECO|nr:hypothetical protein PR202_gb20522 [Eleusine coracana subsp. coracana]
MAVDATATATVVGSPSGTDAGVAVRSPLLPSGAGAAAALAAGEEAAAELDAKYAPYARRDAYGPMGRGPLSAAETVRLALAAVVLVPLRFVAGMLVLVAYYLVCRACTLFVEGAEEGGRFRLSGWRKDAVLRSGRALARAMLFVFGFYWIPETHRGLPNAEDVHQDQSKELERPGAVVSNHVSYVDILYHMSASFPSFVAKESVSRLPLVGIISKCLGCIFVQRESKASDSQGVSGAVTERVQEVCQDKNSPMMLLFPEGTTTNGDYLLPFKTGAFLAGVPVQPVILRYPYRRFSPAWDSMDGAHHVFLLLCQFVNYLEVVRLPIYYPSKQEKDDPKLYASNVRKLIAMECMKTVFLQGNLILSNLGLADKRVYHAALNSNVPPGSRHQKDD